MKLYSLLPSLLCLLVLSDAHSENLLDNSDFSQTRPDGTPIGWIFFYPEGIRGMARASEANTAIDSAVTHDNAKSLRISSDKPTRCSLLQQDLPLLPGQKVHVSVWVKGQEIPTDAKKGAWVRLGFGNRNNPALQKTVDAQTFYLKATESTFDWTKLEGETEIPADTNRVSLDLFLWCTTGTVWYSQPSVEVISGPASASGVKGDSCEKSRYQDENRTLLSATPDEKRVIFVGDSITAKWPLNKSFPGKNGINRGISGQMTGQIYDRFEPDVLALHPKVVVLLAGTNDIANGYSQNASLANLRAMIRLCKEHKIQVLVESLLPVSDYHANINPQFEMTRRRPPQQLIDFNKALEQICHELGAQYLDLYTTLADSSGQLPANLSDDGLHPNGTGYARIAPLVDAAVQQLLGQ